MAAALRRSGGPPFPASLAGASCEGSLDDGYIHIPFQRQGQGFAYPFMGRQEHEAFVSSNGYISFSGAQAGDGETTVIPSSLAKPDDAIFAYCASQRHAGSHFPQARRKCSHSPFVEIQPPLWMCCDTGTDLDFSNGGELWLAVGANAGGSYYTYTWKDVAYYAEHAANPSCHSSTATFQVQLYMSGRLVHFP